MPGGPKKLFSAASREKVFSKRNTSNIGNQILTIISHKKKTLSAGAGVLRRNWCFR